MSEKLSFYDYMAQYFNRIFPLSKERLNFTFSTLKKSKVYLDIGCSVGELCIEMTKKGAHVWGLDLNQKMINIAKKKSDALNLSIQFIVGNMLHVSQYFNENFFSLITCYGNTLVHLDSYEEVVIFFKQVYSLLQSGRIFVFQILNYDLILKKRGVEFSTISTDDFNFIRKYEFQDPKIKFIMTLEFSDHQNHASTFLLPLKRKAIIEALENSGFNNISCSGSYFNTVLNGKEFALLYKAEKP